MRAPSLLTQVLAVNAAVLAGVAGVAAVVAGERGWSEGAPVIGVAVCAAVAVAFALLHRRLEPIERLVDTMSEFDPASPGMRVSVPSGAPREVQRLTADFNRMIARMEHERREAGRAVLRAQEEERGRIAQDLHDEVNQALTGILLRLQATLGDAPEALQDELQETKQLATQAMEELLTLARQLRPTALDDHGLVPALASQVADFGERTGIRASFQRSGPLPMLKDEEQLVIYRVTQESLSNIAQHSGAREVAVELSSVGRTILRIRDDGQGFNGSRRANGHLGVHGMRERALLVGGELAIFSTPGAGTTIELTMEG